MPDIQTKTIRPAWDYLYMAYAIGFLVAFYSAILLVGVPILLGGNATFSDLIFKDTDDLIFSVICAVLLIVVLPLGTAFILSVLGGYRLAEKLFRIRISIWTKLLGPGNQIAVEEGVCLADSLCREGRFAEAEPFYEKAVELFSRLRWRLYSPEIYKVKYLRLLRAQGRDNGTIKVSSLYTWRIRLRRAALIVLAPLCFPILFVFIPWYGYAYVTSFAGNLAPVEQFQKFAGKLPKQFAYIATGYGSPLHCQAFCYGARKSSEGRRREKATLEAAVALDRRTLPADYPWAMQNLAALSYRYCADQDNKSAIRLLEQAFGVAGSAVRYPNATTSSLYNPSLLYTAVLSGVDRLAQLYQQVGDDQKSADTYRKLLDIDELAFGKHSPKLRVVLSHLAHVYFNLGRYVDAEPLEQRLVILQEKVSPPEGDDSLLRTLEDSSGFFIAIGEYKQAEALLTRAAAIAETRGSDYSKADVAQRRAMVARYQQKYSPARAILAPILKDRDKYALLSPLLMASCIVESGEISCAQGNLAQAEKELQQSITIQLREGRVQDFIKQSGYIDLSSAMIILGKIYRLQGDFRKSEALLEGALRVSQDTSKAPPVCPLQELANLYRDRGDYAQAERLYLEVRDILEKSMPPDSGRLAEFFRDYACYLQKTKHPDQANSLVRRAQEIEAKQV